MTRVAVELTDHPCCSSVQSAFQRSGIIVETATLQLAQRNQYPTDIADPFAGADVLKQRFVPVAQKRSGGPIRRNQYPVLYAITRVPGA